MFKHFWKIALRNALGHKGNSLINIVGLAIGFACCLLIMLWVLDELSYDKFHANADDIYRIGVSVNMGGKESSSPRSNLPTGPILVNEFPEVEDAVRLYTWGKVAVRVGDQMFIEERALGVDSSIFNVFSFPMIAGDSARALVAPYSVVLSESTAKKYFGDTNPLGRTIELDSEDEYVVTGVTKDAPSNSHFSYSLLTSMSTDYAKYGPEIDIWAAFNYFTYIRLATGATPADVEAKFPALIETHMGASLEAVGGSARFWLQPLTDIHLHSYQRPEREIEPNGNIMYVYVFSAIAAFVLMIACINFVNLTTAKSATRAKEIGLRKTVGADRLKLIRQFLFESTLFAVGGLLAALLLVELVMPYFETLAGKDLSLNLAATPVLILALLGLALLVGLVAGAYPAFYLSGFRPAGTLKGLWQTRPRKSRLRNILVISQFSVAIALIITTITAFQQVDFMRAKQLGFDKEQVIVVEDINPPTVDRMATIKRQLLATEGVVALGFSTSVPGKQTSRESYLPEGYTETQSLLVDGLHVDPDFIPALGLELTAGRNFSFDHATDQDRAAIVNEAAVRNFGWDNPIGKTIKHRVYTEAGFGWEEKTIIGIVSDYHYASLHKQIAPLFMEYQTDRLSILTIRIAADDISGTVRRLQDSWERLMPDRPFDFYFLDESLDSQYRSEQRLGDLLLAFALLAIATGCLGLFGLAAYIAQQRTKEIGIRKVLGATPSSLIRLMTKEFMLLILIANAIAWPAAYYVSRWWLDSFAYRVDLEWYLFVLSGLVALLIALMSVSYQAVRAAAANPIDSIKYE